MMNRQTTSAHTVRMPTFAEAFGAFLSLLPNPVNYLQAYQNMRRFRSMDRDYLLEAGLSQSDIDNMCFDDFLKQSRR